MPDNDKQIINPTTEPAHPRSRFFWRNIGILLAGVSSGILLMVIILASYGLLAINNYFAATLTQLSNRFDESKNMVVEAQKTAMSAEQSAQQTNETLKSQAQVIADMQKANRTNKDDFLIAEAFYLIKMANDNLQYENNIPLAIKLVQSANQDIAKISDPKVFSVRQALAADLVTLQSAPQVDTAGVYVRLSALNDQIDKLPLLSQLLNNRPEVSTNVNNEKLPWWRRGLNSMQLALERIVVVRKNLPNAPPFIAPDQQIFLYQNLHMELEKTQWGLLHRQQDVYRLSLLQTINWIKQYAVADSSITKQLLQNLEELQKTDVHPSVPNLTGSLQALQNYMSSVGQ
jgi:uroporphyrin-3 C-methyltransferase